MTPNNSLSVNSSLRKIPKREADERKAAGSIIKVIDYLTAHNDSNRGQIMEGTGLAGDSIDTAIKHLSNHKLVTIHRGLKNAKIIHLTKTNLEGYRMWLKGQELPEDNSTLIDFYSSKFWIAFDTYSRGKYGLDQKYYPLSTLLSILDSDRLKSIHYNIKGGYCCPECLDSEREKFHVSENRLIRKEAATDRHSHVVTTEIMAVFTETTQAEDGILICKKCDSQWKPSDMEPMLKEPHTELEKFKLNKQKDFNRIGSKGDTGEHLLTRTHG